MKKTKSIEFKICKSETPDEEDILFFEGNLLCRREPSKKTLKKFQKLGEKHKCCHFMTELFLEGEQMILLLEVGWFKKEFSEKTLEQFTSDLIQVCKDSKDFIIED